MSIVPNMHVPELGAGSAFLLWAFRATAAGQGHCPTLVRGYREFMREDGDAALASVRDLVTAISEHGRRRVKLIAPGCCRLSYDEASIVAAISALQRGENGAIHLENLLGSDTTAVLPAARRTADAFRICGLIIRAPQFLRPANDMPEPTHDIVGRA